MNIEQYIKQVLKESLSKLDYFDPTRVDIKIEQPKQEEHGDYSTNVAMLMPAFAKKAPRLIAEEVISLLELDNQIIDKVEIAGPGFINFFLGWGFYRQAVLEIINQNENFGKSDGGEGLKIQVEFVSANPTGPLNVVSARAAAVGDVLVNLFNSVGYNAQREYYINDAGRQVRLLGKSVSSHYMKIFGLDEELPEEGYHGDYIKNLAEDIAEQKGDVYTKLTASKRHEQLSQLALQKMIYNSREIMKEYGVNYECWFQESQLREAKEDQKILDYLKKKNLSYKKDGATWFKSAQFGDEKDRVLVTGDGEPTYFLIDIAYHKNKYDRGFKVLYDLWGPDHHGYVPRMKAAIEALGYARESFGVEIIQQVNLLRGGEVIKMSKRAGKIIEMKEVVDEVGVDAARFFFVNRKVSSHLDFDIDLAKKQSEENPVYYLQYAHARICSILKFAEEKGIDLSKNANLDLLDKPEEKDLIKGLIQFPKILIKAAESLEPHLLTHYLKDVAALFHHFYHFHRVVSDDMPLSQTRLTLVKATRIVLATGFKILGISAPERM